MFKESADALERAGAQESTVDCERAETTESTEMRERP